MKKFCLFSSSLLLLFALSTVSAQGQDSGLPSAPTPKFDATRLVHRNTYAPLSGGERWHRYWNGSVLSPNIYFASLGAALGDQASGSPKEWGGGWPGYGRRVGSMYGLFLTRESIHQGGAALLGTDPRYFRCDCKGGLRRSWHAVASTFVTRNHNGKKVFDLPQIAGAYGSGMVSHTWYPSRYSPLVQGVQTGHMQVGFVAGVNLVREFSPELKRVFRIGRSPKTADPVTATGSPASN